MPTSGALNALPYFFDTALFLFVAFFFVSATPPRNWQDIPYYRLLFQRTPQWRLVVFKVASAVCSVVAVGFAAYTAFLAFAVAPTTPPATPAQVADAVQSIVILISIFMVLTVLLLAAQVRARRAVRGLPMPSVAQSEAGDAAAVTTPSEA